MIKKYFQLIIEFDLKFINQHIYFLMFLQTIKVIKSSGIMKTLRKTEEIFISDHILLM